MKIDFDLANGADPDEKYRMGVHCLPKYPFSGFRSTKG